MAYLCYTTDLYTAHRDYIKSIDKSKDIVKITLSCPPDSPNEYPDRDISIEYPDIMRFLVTGDEWDSVMAVNIKQLMEKINREQDMAIERKRGYRSEEEFNKAYSAYDLLVKAWEVTGKDHYIFQRALNKFLYEKRTNKL